VAGTGTVNYVTKWSATDTIANSTIYDNGTTVLIGSAATLSSQKLQVTGDVKADTFVATDLSNNVVPYHVNDTTGLDDSKIFTNNTNVNLGTNGPYTYRLNVTNGIGTDDIAISGSLAYETPTSTNEFHGEVVYFGAFEPGLIAVGTLMVLGNNGIGAYRWYKAKNDSENKATLMLGIALGTTASAGVLVRGFARTSAYSSFIVGTKLYLSSTSGLITSTAPASDYIRIVGYALESDTIYFCPDNTYVLL